MIPLIGLLIGLIIGLFINIPVSSVWAPYLALLVLSSIDALLHFYSKHRKQSISSGKFLFQFLANTVVAVLITALGNQINFELSNIVALVFAYRIFKNLTALSSDLYDRIKNRKLLAHQKKTETASVDTSESEEKNS